MQIIRITSTATLAPARILNWRGGVVLEEVDSEDAVSEEEVFEVDMGIFLWFEKCLEAARNEVPMAATIKTSDSIAINSRFVKGLWSHYFLTLILHLDDNVRASRPAWA
jgi:hypothetical protein